MGTANAPSPLVPLIAIWGLASKAREMPLFRLIRQVFRRSASADRVPVYAGGGYVFPNDELACLRDEAHRFHHAGFRAMKMKVGAHELAFDCRRIETALEIFGTGDSLAVDAMNAYSARCNIVCPACSWASRPKCSRFKVSRMK